MSLNIYKIYMQLFTCLISTVKYKRYLMHVERYPFNFPVKKNATAIARHRRRRSNAAHRLRLRTLTVKTAGRPGYDVNSLIGEMQECSVACRSLGHAKCFY